LEHTNNLFCRVSFNKPDCASAKTILAANISIASAVLSPCRTDGDFSEAKNFFLTKHQCINLPISTATIAGTTKHFSWLTEAATWSPVSPTKVFV